MQMSFHAPIKELQPIDTSLPEHIVKGAVVLDLQLTEWNKRAIIASNTLPNTFILINRKEESMDDVLRKAASQLQLPENESYGLIEEKPKRFVTNSTLDRLEHGFMLTMSASPDHYVRRINEILSEGNDLRKMEWAVAKLDEFSLDPALIEAFYRFSSLDLLFSLIRDDRVCMSSSLLCSCLRALSSMLELGVGSVGWRSVPRDVVVSVASLVTGRAKREETNTLLFALQMIEQLVNSDQRTRDWVIEEVPIETLIRHVEKSDERISLASLTLMNAMLEQCVEHEKRIEMIKALEVVPFRNAVHSSLLRAGNTQDENVREQLIAMQRHLLAAADISQPTDAEIQQILDIDESSEVELVREARCGRLFTTSLMQFVVKQPQDLRMLISENEMRTEGGKWELVALGVRCANLVGELFGILPGREELAHLIPVFFSSDCAFGAVFACTLQLFHRTWREMHAKVGELEKVANVVGEQIRHVLHSKHVCDVEELSAALEAFSYREMQEIWREEQAEKENDQLHSQVVVDLGKRLRSKVEEIVRINLRNYLKKGATFRRSTKAKNVTKQTYWFWKLDASEKMLTMTVCDSEKYEESGEHHETTRQVWLKDIADVSTSDEIDRKGSSSRFVSNSSSTTIGSPMLIRGIRVQLKEGEVLSALTNDEKIASIWIEALSQLIAKPGVRSYTQTMVERILKMELRVRLLNVKVSEIGGDELEIPPMPENMERIMAKYA